MSREEKANTWTHLVPAVATLFMAWPLLRLSLHSHANLSLTEGTGRYLAVVGTSLFLLGSFLMFSSSTIYHAVSHPVHKARLRVFDHISIYVMIAGSYSPICLSVIGGWIGWTVFGFLWACVIAGIVGKTIALGKHPRLSLALYLAMGWTALVILRPMWHAMPHTAFWWVIAEGVLYTVGSYFFNHDEEHAYYHAIWHVFITLGALSHTIALWLILS